MPAIAQTLDFNNTELAFQAQSGARLARTWWMYRMIASPFLAANGPKWLSLAFRLGLPVEGVVRKTLFEVFCGGESIDDTLHTTETLDRFGVKTILDYSVEGEKTEAGFDATFEEIRRTLMHGGKHEAVAFSACKVTGLASFELLEQVSRGEALSPEAAQAWDRVRHRLHRLAETAVAQRTPLFIDAEESWIQDAIDALAEELMETCNQGEAWIFTTAQLYRHDRLEYLRGLVARSQAKGYRLGVKLVRGAYHEKESERAREMGYPDPIQPDKAATDRDFDAALKLCIDHIGQVSVCAGTHNEASSRYLTELMAAAGLEPGDKRVWFAQLLGMSDHISFNLAHAGYNTAKYLPYGPVRSVMPYLMRRAQENTSIAGQTGRELSLLTQEVKRRRHSAR
ncbi:MAG: proline dehydrogenase family protein [Bacteroidia bacterium]|nr:proline dehydrogenase family protein [Bacteroidia bacterium]